MLEEEIQILMRKNLRNCFNSFDENYIVNVHVNNPNNICIGYRTTAETINELRGTTHFDIQLIDDICYILYIELEKSKRGRGERWSLYKAIHSFAGEFGSRYVKQTPSSWTGKSKTRREYLLKRGYFPFGKVEVELKL